MIRTAGSALLAALAAVLADRNAAAAVPVVTSDCTRAITAAEAGSAVPDGLLLAIGFGEAGRKVEDGVTIWPWTVNVEGQGRYLESREAALAFVREQQGLGRRSIDVGCMQINLRWHPGAFASLEEAFDPVANAGYALRLLNSLRAATGLDGAEGWMRAVGHYHSQTPALAARYRAYIAGHWDRIDDPVVLASLGGAEVLPERAGEPPPSAPAAGEDPFGLALLAYWATPFGHELGPPGAPLFDTSVRVPIATAEPIAREPARRPLPPQLPARRAQPRPPGSLVPGVRQQPRPGLMRQQTRG